MIKFIIYFCYCLISFFIVYKFIKRIDKRERKYARKWEKEYVEAYKDIWKEQYFLRLAEEKKLKEFESRSREEHQEQKEKLKYIQIEDLDSFTKNYEESLNDAEILIALEEEKK